MKPCQAMPSLTLLSLCTFLSPTSKTHSQSTYYPYHSEAFSKFLGNSLEQHGQSTNDFYSWLNARFRAESLKSRSIEDWTQKIQSQIDSESDVNRKSQVERSFAANVYSSLRKMIPHFSFDRGFEFSDTICRGERQCFLQSVLAASVLQSTGIPAGVAMVYRNMKGEESNNGHAVTVVRLANGRDLVLDLSERKSPFPTHRGLFATVDGQYRFVCPIYGPDKTILAYRAESGGQLDPSRVEMLGSAFIESQFDYYRGERAPGGVMADRRTSNGLKQSEQHLTASVRECPANPLALVILGRVHYLQGKHSLGRQEVESAIGLYHQYGWTPEGAMQAVTLTHANVR